MLGSVLVAQPSFPSSFISYRPFEFLPSVCSCFFQYIDICDCFFLHAHICDLCFGLFGSVCQSPCLVSNSLSVSIYHFLFAVCVSLCRLLENDTNDTISIINMCGAMDFLGYNFYVCLLLSLATVLCHSPCLYPVCFSLSFSVCPCKRLN